MTVRAAFDEIALAIFTPLLADLTQTEDTEKRNEAAFQIGAMKNRCEHDSKERPNPSYGEEMIRTYSQGMVHLLDSLIAEAEPDHFAHIIEGITWSIHNQT